MCIACYVVRVSQERPQKPTKQTKLGILNGSTLGQRQMKLINPLFTDVCFSTLESQLTGNFHPSRKGFQAVFEVADLPTPLAMQAA